jgi:hypothetical protein
MLIPGRSIRWMCAVIGVLSSAGWAQSVNSEGWRSVLGRDLGLAAMEIASLERGSIVRRTIVTSRPSEVRSLGAIRIHGNLDDFSERFEDLVQPERSDSTPSSGQLLPATVRQDLNRLVIPADDLDEMIDCTVAKCSVKLTGTMISRLELITRLAPRSERRRQAAAAFRDLLADRLREYSSGGAGVLEPYQEDSGQGDSGAARAALLDDARPLLRVAPELKRFLRDFPHADLPGAVSSLRWQRQPMGHAVAIVLMHDVTYRTTYQGTRLVFVVSRDVYCSHYVRAFVGTAVAVEDRARGAFYVVDEVRARIDPLGGSILGRLKRWLVERKVTGEMEKRLREIKRSLERRTASREARPRASHNQVSTGWR